jgi:uncharacterized membrane protein YeaQ/YmgE (transglycosylase-associated protein family)
MFSLLIWVVYGLFVGSLAKAIVPINLRLGFFQTIALGVAGSYMGGAMLYMLGTYDSLSPSGIFMGVTGGIVTLLLYNNLIQK